MQLKIYDLCSVFFIILTLECVLWWPRQVYGTTTAPKRNALLLLADDGGFEMGVYRNRICQTPNLDALAKQSLIFNNAFTSVSSCSPSRASILTGMPSHQNGMYGLHNGEHHFNAFDSLKSLPTILQHHKIRTGLIGKKHVGPSKVFTFDYERTDEMYPINQVGRNITNMKNLVREFLQQNSSRPFFLMVAFHDPHRCGHVTPQYGPFCERWGADGLIPDWHPIYYQWDEIDLPYYVPDTEPARRDIAAQYTTISRLDQGIGLILRELKDAGHLDDTLVIYTSDNGPPLPAGRTNLYDPGVREPMFISSPENKERHNQVTYSMSSHLDLMPTMLDWFNVTQQAHSHRSHLLTNSVHVRPTLTGKSLLPLLEKEPPEDPDAAVFMSQNYHEITMNYAMRAIRTKRYKLIHNLNYGLPFPIDQDFYVSPTFQDILNRTITNQPLPWYKTLKSYYKRDEWELYDLKYDPTESKNLVQKTLMDDVRSKLAARLSDWMSITQDPWRCYPHGVLQDKGAFKNDPQCMTLNV